MEKQEYIQCPNCHGTGKVKNTAHQRWFNLGQVVKLQMEAKGLTQEQLASNVGITRTSLTNFFAGKQRPPLDVIVAYAEALDLDLSELIKHFSAPLP